MHQAFFTTTTLLDFDSDVFFCISDYPRFPFLWFSWHCLQNQKVVLDEGDGPGFFPPVGTNFLAYFKRSWPLRKDGKYAGPAKRHARNYWPMAYSVSDDYTAPLFGHLHVKGHGDTLRLAPADLRQYDVSAF